MVASRPVSVLLLAAVALLALLAVPAARAGVRTAVITDPRDGWPTASGQPSTPDLARAEVVYDTTGRLTLTADFYEDVQALSTDRAYAWSLRFAVGRPSPTDAAVCMPLVQGHVHLAGLPGVRIADRLAIAGTDGYLPLVPEIVTPPYSASGSRLAFTATTPTLRGRDLRCAVVTVWARERVEEDLAGAVYDEPCDCWYVGVVDDTAARVFFRGFGPSTTKPKRPTPAAPPRRGPRRASAIRILVDREYCQLSIGLMSLTPGEGGAVSTERWGSFVVQLTGPTRRTVRRPLGAYHPGVSLPIVLIRGLRGGTYTIRAHYTGDVNRRPSPPVVKQMRVVCT